MPTLKEMSRLYYLEKQIQADRERLAAIRARGSPGYGGSFGKKSSEPEAEEQDRRRAEALEKRIEHKIKQCVEEEHWLMDVLDRIDDPMIRLAVTERCKRGKSWVAVAIAVGGDNTADGVIKQCGRYLRKMHVPRRRHRDPYKVPKKPDTRQVKF